MAAARQGEAGEVAILLTDDAEMRALNKQWRGLDKATDVLSFPGEGPEIPGQPQYLGDIAVGYETARRDADAMRRPFEAHMAHLLIHGFLHLLGYDHIEAEDAKVMEPLEAELLAGLGWPDPYATGPYAGNGES
ncbi:MAG: rRNA maturation RNase YbeY [Rhodobacterales bacterium 12-64-8]|nr:MAG: rRNA maturation RNase YbeY [Rhodobacterales bacterium 12-64-8]OYX45762.1 MAG: rRNA maturation RNase YbeY [Alphaproteobacteria bacterium 32-64-14]